MVVAGNWANRRLDLEHREKPELAAVALNCRVWEREEEATPSKHTTQRKTEDTPTRTEGTDTHGI